MQVVLQQTYNDLGSVPTDQHPVLLTEPALNPTKNRFDTRISRVAEYAMHNRAQAAELFFETFNVPAMFVQVSVRVILVL